MFDELINLTLKACESWIKIDNQGELLFVDPIDKEEISAHYGATHTAAAFIILGKAIDDSTLLEKGKVLLKSIIKRWDTNKMLNDFHADFNNFALCVAYDSLKKGDIDARLCEEIKIKILLTSDSNHNTINWLPMRWYVNLKRFEWTNNQKYQKICEDCKLLITKATNTDGSIEDILPKGMSFNLQYDIATVGLLQFLRCREVDIDVSKEFGFLTNVIAPDGDINYHGRGANQIFAWGIWIYLLSSSNYKTELKNSISFLMDKVPEMLKNNNIVLNKWKGEEKYLWWDYHYSSVYTAHFLFWLVLAKKDFQKKAIKFKNTDLKDSGVSIKKSSDYFISTFKGRKKYLAETGPLISLFWMKKYGTIFKGTFGPWQGLFGNKYSYGDVVLRNYFGLLKIESNRDWSKNRFVQKLRSNKKTSSFVKILPITSRFTIKEELNQILIKFENNKRENVVLNLPVLDSISKKPSINLFVDGKPMMMMNNIKIRTQYGWCNIYQSKKSNEKEWLLRIQ